MEIRKFIAYNFDYTFKVKVIEINKTAQIVFFCLIEMEISRTKLKNQKRLMIVSLVSMNVVGAAWLFASNRTCKSTRIAEAELEKVFCFWSDNGAATHWCVSWGLVEDQKSTNHHQKDSKHQQLFVFIMPRSALNWVHKYVEKSEHGLHKHIAIETVESQVTSSAVSLFFFFVSQVWLIVDIS